jgi:phage-related protein/DNA-binding XRE family transcriptional regulator
LQVVRNFATLTLGGEFPRTKIVLFREADGTVPLLDWLAELPEKARLKCRARIQRLTELGHELRRPEADYLRDGIYELRVGLRGMNYRMFYFFHGQVAAVISHGMAKERIVPPKEIDAAVARKAQFEKHPEASHARGELTMKRLRKKKPAPTTDAVEIIDRRFFAGRKDLDALYQEESANLEVARKIYDLRTSAGLTQRQLAKRVGTTASVICRLEDADYEGHSLAMLRRIAGALNQRVEIRFVPQRAKRRAA